MCRRGRAAPSPALRSAAPLRPLSLKDGTKTMLRYHPPCAPACTQWPAVHTRLLRPGFAGSLTTVAEQTAWPSGMSKSSLPVAGEDSWYGVARRCARIAAGSGSVVPSSARPRSGRCSSSGVPSALRSRSASQRSLMTGLMKSAASRSHLSLSQFFQPPSFSASAHLSRSSRLVGRAVGSWSPPSPDVAVGVGLGLASALSSDGPQAVAVTASSAAATAAAANRLIGAMGCGPPVVNTSSTRRLPTGGHPLTMPSRRGRLTPRRWFLARISAPGSCR